MKKLFSRFSILMLMLVVMLLPLIAEARSASSGDCNSVVVTVDSYPVAGTEGAYYNGSPNNALDISSNTYKIGFIYELDIVNTNPAIRQTVSLYDDCLSTSTLDKIWEVVVGTSTTGSGIYQKSFTSDNPLPFDNGLMIRKSSNDSVVTVNIEYE